MSETMIERVARAIYDTTGVEGVTLPWEKARKGARDLHIEWARAAIEAMRSPDDTMTDAIEEQLSLWMNDEGVGVDVYLAAIDAALKEPTK